MPPPGGAVLVVYPFCLDHVGHGNIQRLLAIAHYLAASGMVVDLVYQGSPRVPVVTGQYAGFRRVFAVEGGASSTDEQACAARLAAFYSGHDLPPVHMRPSAPLTTLVRSLIDAEGYRAVVATYAFTAPIFADLRRRVLMVCDVQDVMHEHAGACEAATGQASSFTMPAPTESYLWRQWDVVVAITPEDATRIARDLAPSQHLISARHAPPCAAVAAPGASDVALYAASDNQSNVQSVTWLLEHVWPRVRQARPSARLRMAGLICAALPERLRAMPGLELLGFLDDLSGEIATCGVVVAPYLYGSGLKIKVVEAACAGKAVVTTSSGVAGTGLQAGRALERHDEPEPFAAAVAALLGDQALRRALAETARGDAAALFSAEACYGPMASLIRLLGTTTTRSVSGVAPAVIERVHAVVQQVRPTRLVVWGNGAHTRALLPALATVGVTAQLIVDGRANGASLSTEGVAVVPGAAFARTHGDLIVLSSETFEPEMWRDLAADREAGGHVLGLSNPHYVSRGLSARLSAPSMIRLGAAPLAASRAGDTPLVALWDSGAVAARWWRVRAQSDLAVVIAGLGLTPVVASPASTAARAELRDEFPANIQVLPILELSGHSIEDRDVHGGPRALARAIDVMAASSAGALARLHLGAGDRLVVMDPSLSECFGLARTLSSVPVRDNPAVVLWMTGAVSDALQLSPGDRRAYWRLATSALADICGGRVTVVATDAAEVSGLQDELGHPVRGVSYPAAPPKACRGPRGTPHVVCLGHVSVPEMRPMLEALVTSSTESGAAPLAVSWRSRQLDARPGADDHWATGLASLLGITLLDDAAPSAMPLTFAAADAIVVLPGRAQKWHGAVHHWAGLLGVPIITPIDPADAVRQVRAAVARRLSSAARPYPESTVPGPAGRDASLADVFFVPSSPLLVTETCQ